MEIIEVKHGVANNFGSYIEVNKHLKKYPHLYGPILSHEIRHTDKTYSLHDFKVDIIPRDKLSTFELMKFMLKHPLSFTQLLPFYYSPKKGFVYDISLIIMYLIMVIVFGGTVWLGAKFI